MTSTKAIGTSSMAKSSAVSSISRSTSDTIQQLLRERASSDAVAVLFGDQQQTWRDHVRGAQARAAALLALADCGRPFHVGVLLGNSPEIPESDGGSRSRRVCAVRDQHHPKG